MTMQQTTTANDRAPVMLPPKKAAAALGLPEYTVRQWLAKGLIKGVPCGRKRLINVDLLREQLSSGTGEVWR